MRRAPFISTHSAAALTLTLTLLLGVSAHAQPIEDFETQRQVYITSKFLQVQESNLGDLGFDWLLGPFTVPGVPEITFPGHKPTGSGSTVIVLGTPPPPNITVGSASDTFLRDLTNPNRGFDIPVTNGRGNPLPLGSMFTDPQFQIILRGLEQRNGNILSAPSVVTRSGGLANIEIIREFIYPTEYDPPEIPQDFGMTGNAAFPGFPVTPATPSMFQNRNVGVTLNVDPVVGRDGTTINLNIAPDVVEFEGFINYGTPIQTDTVNPVGGPRRIYVSGESLPQPELTNRDVATTLTIQDGQTVALGGLVNEDEIQQEEKVPILGDIPVLGRLFKTQSSDVTKQGLTIFVTPYLYDANGHSLNPVSGAPVVANYPTPDPTENTTTSYTVQNATTDDVAATFFPQSESSPQSTNQLVVPTTRATANESYYSSFPVQNTSTDQFGSTQTLVNPIRRQPFQPYYEQQNRTTFFVTPIVGVQSTAVNFSQSDTPFMNMIGLIPQGRGYDFGASTNPEFQNVPEDERLRNRFWVNLANRIVKSDPRSTAAQEQFNQLTPRQQNEEALQIAEQFTTTTLNNTNTTANIRSSDRSAFGGINAGVRIPIQNVGPGSSVNVAGYARDEPKASGYIHTDLAFTFRGSSSNHDSGMNLTTSQTFQTEFSQQAINEFLQTDPGPIGQATIAGYQWGDVNINSYILGGKFGLGYTDPNGVSASINFTLGTRINDWDANETRSYFLNGMQVGEIHTRSDDTTAEFYAAIEGAVGIPLGDLARLNGFFGTQLGGGETNIDVGNTRATISSDPGDNWYGGAGIEINVETLLDRLLRNSTAGSSSNLGNSNGSGGTFKSSSLKPRRAPHRRSNPR
ncbi:MAG: type II and III secretion system protein [Verrucomicrobiota bacterium]